MRTRTVKTNKKKQAKTKIINGLVVFDVPLDPKITNEHLLELEAQMDLEDVRKIWPEKSGAKRGKTSRSKV